VKEFEGNSFAKKNPFEDSKGWFFNYLKCNFLTHLNFSNILLIFNPHFLPLFLRHDEKKFNF
jgi:hypothetical protein